MVNSGNMGPTLEGGGAGHTKASSVSLASATNGSASKAGKSLSKRYDKSVLDRDMIFPQIANGSNQQLV